MTPATVTESPTPATTTETTTSAAPAISEPSPSSTASQRPASMREALEQAAATSDSAPAAPTDPAAIAQAASATTPGVHPTTDKEGPIPFEVHHKALANARTKAGDEAVAKYREQYGWAESINRDQFTAWVDKATRIATDPVGHMRELAEELQSHPQWGPQFRSEAARILGGGRSAAAPAAVSFEPDVQVVDEHGRVTGATFSDAKVKALLEQQKVDLLAAVDAKYGGVATAHEKSVAAEQAAAREIRDLNTKADQMVEDVNDIVDGDEQRLIEVAKAITEHPDWSPRKAALTVRDRHVSKSLEGQATAKVVDSFNRKAAGNTANGAGAPATPSKPRTREELARHMETLGG